MKEVLEHLTAVAGVSGREDEIRRVVGELVRPYADEVGVDALGNLIAHKFGLGPRLMLVAHLDEIGLIVTEVDERGFLRFMPVGSGIPAWRLVGARVAFSNGVPGVVGQEKVEEVKDLRPARLFIDIGATSAEEARALTGGTGAVASFAPSFSVCCRRVVAKALDDRAGCALLVRLLTELREVPNDLVVVFSVQEEVGQRGARTAAFGLHPAVAVAIDVSPAGDTPEAERRTVALGKGPAVKVMDTGLIAHPAVRELLLEIAGREGIPHQREVLERGATDAAVIQVTLEGIPSGAVSLPCRYVHSAAEMIDLDDLEGAYRLLRALALTPLAGRF
ncbi:MAG: M20/M25/M40 family metallo-hydrolase [Bacillota bacterium]|nr:M20/M25/M40 family metallo-hydrolase [Bacillota bacterium]